MQANRICMHVLTRLCFKSTFHTKKGFPIRGLRPIRPATPSPWQPDNKTVAHTGSWWKFSWGNENCKLQLKTPTLTDGPCLYIASSPLCNLSSRNNFKKLKRFLWFKKQHFKLQLCSTRNEIRHLLQFFACFYGVFQQSLTATSMTWLHFLRCFCQRAVLQQQFYTPLLCWRSDRVFIIPPVTSFPRRSIVKPFLAYR